MKNNFFLKFYGYLRCAWRELLVIVLIGIADLASKNIVNATMQLGGPSVAVIPGLLYFDYVMNDGAAYSQSFGLEKLVGKDGVVPCFIALTIVALIIFAFFLWHVRKRHFVVRLSLAMIIGGAFGNLVDRIVLGAVRDFIRLQLFGFSPFGCFNIADMALVFGVIIFAIYFLFMFDKDDKRLEKEKQSGAENCVDCDSECAGAPDDLDGVALDSASNNVEQNDDDTDDRSLD